MPIKPTELQVEAHEAFNTHAQAFRKNQSAFNWIALELAMLALQQSKSKFTSGHDLARAALNELAKSNVFDRAKAEQLMAQQTKDPEAFNSMNAASLAK
jgi:hypothetical protein